MRNYLYFIISIFILSSCKTDSNTSTTAKNESHESEAYVVALNNLTKEPGKASAQAFINASRKALAISDDKAKNENYLLEGLRVAEEYKMGPTAIAFLMPLVKDYGSNEKKEEHLAKLASALQDVGKSIPADMLTKAYLDKYPSGTYNELLTKKRKSELGDIDSHLKGMAEEIFVNPDQFGINRQSAQKYVDACEAYALGYPTNDDAADYLYKAAEMARTLKTFPKALNIYDWLIEKYPNYEKTPTALFLKGFMLENELNDKEAARSVYQGFLKKYPKSDLVDDVTFLLDNIDKSDEEIMKIIDQQKKK